MTPFISQVHVNLLSLEQQAIVIYRIGQTKDIIIKRYIVGGMDQKSIEKRILEIQRNKLELIKEYLD